jgi:uncharacterized Zn finger protein
MATFESQWEHFFRPEARSSGRALVSKGVVQLAQPSDTEIQAFIRISAAPKVSLKMASVESAILQAGCSCPAGKKGAFCKHIWAVLLQTESTKPDFLEGKSEIEMQTQGETVNPAKVSPQALAQAETRKAAQESLKERQNQYRKDQYQKQKSRLKELKGGAPQAARANSRLGSSASAPSEVQESLQYFATNGFEMSVPYEAEAVQHAKKTLSRVFHPDKGGTHAEILELNRNADVLLEFLGTR